MQYPSLSEDINPGCSDFLSVWGECCGSTSPTTKTRKYPTTPRPVYQNRKRIQRRNSEESSTLRDVLAKVKLEEAQVASLWARSESDVRTSADLPSVLVEIKYLQDELREKVQKLTETRKSISSHQSVDAKDIEQVLKSFTETEERLGEYLKMMASQLERFEEDSKEILIELQQDKETSLNNSTPRMLRELMLSFHIFKERWETLANSKVKEKMNEVANNLKEAQRQLETIFGVSSSITPSRSSWDILLQSSRTKSLDLLAKEMTRDQTDGPLMNHFQSNHKMVEEIQKKSFASVLYDSGTPKRQEVVPDIGRKLRRCSVVGDGRCLFRAIAKGRAYAIGINHLWSDKVEREEADKLRTRVVAELKKRKDLLSEFSVIEGDFEEYVQNIAKTHTYAGEPELLLLASILHMPIAVYVYALGSADDNNGPFRQIQVYGRQFRGEPLNLLY
eukprot:jgi/Galph1/1695/GphlegSOOS_G393.1